MAKYVLPLMAALVLVCGCGRSSDAQALTNYGKQKPSSLAYVHDDADSVTFAWDAPAFAPAPALKARAQAEYLAIAEEEWAGEIESPAYGGAGNAYTTSGDGGGTAPALAEIDAERKLVKRADIRTRVENLAASDSFVAALMAEHGAYAASTFIHEDSRSYSIRVPAPAYSAFVAGATGMGRTLSYSENAEDVTLRYYDLEGRLATKRELLKTYQSYLGRARNIEEILSVEARIADLQNEIDGTGRELRNLANRVDYATVDLTVLGPVASTPYRGPTLPERVKELFNSFGGFLSGIAIALVGIVIYGIPIVILLAACFWLFFGKIGLLKKLWHLVVGKKNKQ